MCRLRDLIMRGGPSLYAASLFTCPELSTFRCLPIIVRSECHSPKLTKLNLALVCGVGFVVVDFACFIFIMLISNIHSTLVNFGELNNDL